MEIEIILGLIILILSLIGGFYIVFLLGRIYEFKKLERMGKIKTNG